jgi:opacity protein-like surface antigen
VSSRLAASVATALGLAILSCGGQPARGEDSAERRYYLQIRYGDIIPGLSEATDIIGVSVGANLNRYFGLEFALDNYDTKVEDLSEVGVFGLVPQLRLRYPLLGDRLTPYIAGGAGLSVTQANDQRRPVSWPDGKTAVHPAGTLLGGVEYFIADNIAVGVEGKYLFSGDVPYTNDSTGARGTKNTSAGFLAIGLRLFYPELHPEENAAAARAARARFYVGFPLGAALLVDMEPFPGVHASPEQPIFDSNFAPVFGLMAGATIGRYLAVEIELENYELSLRSDDAGKLGEYAVFPLTLQPRLRYPLLEDRLELSATAGVGAELAEINDRGKDPSIAAVDADDVAVIGIFGVGIDYYPLHNVSIGAEAQYIVSRGHGMQIDHGPVLRGNLDAFVLTLGLRVFLLDV